MRNKKFIVLLFLLLLIVIYRIYFNNKSSQSSIGKEEPQSELSSQSTLAKEEHQSTLSSKPVDKPKIDKTKKEESKTIDILPKSMRDVKLTDKLKRAIEEYPGGYEKFDYKLRFYDNLFACLDKNIPNSGQIITQLYFTIDENRKIAIGSDGSETGNIEAFKTRNSNLSQLDEDRVMLCAREAHVGQKMDITNSFYPDNIRDFYNPTIIVLPQKENDIYWFLSHDGEYKNE